MQNISLFNGTLLLLLRKVEFGALEMASVKAKWDEYLQEGVGSPK